MRKSLAAVTLAGLAAAACACSAPPVVPPLSSPLPAGMIADGSGVTCPATALGADGQCPGSKPPEDLAWPSWPPPSPVTRPGTVTFIVRGSPSARVRYGPDGATVAGSSPMTLTQPLDGQQPRELHAALQGSGSITVMIAVDGTVVSQDTAAGGWNIALAEIAFNPATSGWGQYGSD